MAEKLVIKEEKEITIKVGLPAQIDGHLADTNHLVKSACMMLNEKQKKQKEKGYCWLHYSPVLNDVIE